MALEFGSYVNRDSKRWRITETTVVRSCEVIVPQPFMRLSREHCPVLIRLWRYRTPGGGHLVPGCRNREQQDRRVWGRRYVEPVARTATANPGAAVSRDRPASFRSTFHLPTSDTAI